jgi:hypothetical protein
MSITRTLSDADRIAQLERAVYELTERLRRGISDPMGALSPEHRMIIERAAYSYGQALPPEPKQQDERTAL